MLGHLGEARKIFGITPFPFGRKGSLTFRDPGVRGWGEGSCADDAE